MGKIDISFVVTAHREQYYLWMTLKSIRLMREVLTSSRIDSELILVADDADEETKRIISSAAEGISKIIFCEHRDPSLSRNLGIGSAKGELIAILDGDDLFSKNWVIEAYNFFAKSNNKEICLHPEYNFMFEGDCYWWRHIDQKRKDFTPFYMMTDNYWTANCVFPKLLFDKCSYVPSRHGEGFGYEDWAFNCDVISAGYVHKVVQNTSHFIRIKKGGSRNQTAIRSGLATRQTDLFREIVRLEVPKHNLAYYSAGEARLVPERLVRHAKELSEIEPVIKKQLNQTERIRRFQPKETPVTLFRDYKKLIAIIRTTISFVGEGLPENYICTLGSIFPTDGLIKKRYEQPNVISGIGFDYRPDLRSLLFLRTFLYKKVKTINIINSSAGVDIVKCHSKAFLANFDVVFYFTYSDANRFIEESGAEVLELIRAGVSSENIRISSPLYEKFLAIYSDQWRESISECKL